MIHAITLGAVPGFIEYSNICFEFFLASNDQDSLNENEQPVYEICTDDAAAYEFITIMVPPQMVNYIRWILTK